MLGDHPIKQRNDPLRGRHQVGALIEGFVVLCKETARQIGDPETQGPLVDRRDQNVTNILGELHQAGCTTPACNAEFAFLDEADLSQRRDTVCDDCAPQLAFTF